MLKSFIPLLGHGGKKKIYLKLHARDTTIYFIIRSSVFNPKLSAFKRESLERESLREKWWKKDDSSMVNGTVSAAISFDGLGALPYQ